MAIKSSDDFVTELLTVLGLPQGTVSFSLNAAVDKLVTVDCTYKPDPKDPSKVLSERFKLVRINEPEQGT